jgi:hypothetical protein
MQSVEHPLDPEVLSEYLDGELPSERASAVEHHLAGCIVCQKVCDDLAGVSRDLAAWRIETAPDTLRVRRVLGEGSFDKPWRPRWLPSWALYPSVGLATVAIVLVAVVPMLQLARPRRVQVDASLAAPAAETGAEALMFPRPIVAARPSGTPPSPQGQQGAIVRSAPRVVRTATLRVLSKDLDASRRTVDRIVRDAGGYVGEVNITGVRPEPRALRATLRVPSARLDEAIAALKSLGEVVEESQSADDVTEQMVDLEARLANSRNTEQRMNELLRTRTGKLSEVLEAEREVARVREEIERLDAQRKNLDGRVAYSAISLHVTEARKSSLNLGPLPLTARLRNALVDGFRTAFESAVGAMLLALQIAPFLAFWALLLVFPARFLLRRLRARSSAAL